MLCEKCKKNEARINLVKILNGQKQEIWLCENCARDIADIPMLNSISKEIDFPFQGILTGLISNFNNVSEKKELVCPNCGMHYDEFKKTGKLGCSECYEEFSKSNEPLVKTATNFVKYAGKIPKRNKIELSQKKKLKDLKESLQKLILEEDYEKAAVIRDSISEIEKSIIDDSISRMIDVEGKSIMRNWIHNLANNEDIVLSTKIQLARNLKLVPFPNKLDYMKARENAELIYEVLNDTIYSEDMTLYKLWENDKKDYEDCIEKHLINKNLLDNSEKGAFIVNKNETISIMINEGEHIKIQCITAGLNLEEAFNSANIIDDNIESKLEYAFNENLGYLMESPKNIGTGLEASIDIHLPALTMNNEIDKISKTFDRLGMSIKSIYNYDSEKYGNIYRISNKSSLGIKEHEIIGTLKGVVLNVISEEKRAKEVLLSKNKYEVENKVYRAYAILQSAVLLDEKEAIELLSDIRLGVELNLLNIENGKINQLLVMIKNSSIENYIGRPLNIREINYERANLVKRILI
ncbi:Putative kinase [Clostridium neonatale]|nr:Putative kinase [Clostridium neonatale]